MKFTKIIGDYALGGFYVEDKSYVTSLHISQVSEEYDTTFQGKISLGEIYKASIIDFDSVHKKWRISLK